MNRIIHRDSSAMRIFSSASENLAGELEESSSRLWGMIQDASGYMQDESGTKAIEIVFDLLEEVHASIQALYRLANHINESAKLLEEADLLL